ncbi:unnamed protein product [Victoria cruziana]
MNLNFKLTNPSNLVHIMSYSGARGNASQVHQLVGIRGLMSDPQGQMIDLPIQSNLCEGLSLTEYTISCYGARKGVVDTVVRMSDARYFMRRLVEVFQHIVVRRMDCGSTRGISMSLRKGMTERIFIQMLIGCVLANDVYLDIGIGLVNRFMTSRAQPIYIRTPFTCQSTSWICRLCYGRSPTHGDLVELGEAVGIITGQSIGEPGTQLTLRTFHTGGVFTGGTTEHVRAPSNQKIKFNEDLVHPTCTCHGHPVFLCYVYLYVTIKSQDIIHSVNIPPKSFLLVQNDQYVESKQVIAEIRAGTSTFHFKERGEMHWSTSVYHAPEYTHGNVHFLPKTSHLWILSGGPCKSSLVPFSLHKDQDQMNVQSLSVHERSIFNFSVNNNRVRHKLFGSDPLVRKGRRISDYAEKELTPHSSTSITVEIPANSILCRNSIFAYFDDPRYRRSSSRITKYGIIEVDSIVKKEGLIEYRRPKESRPKYQMKVDQFFVIPEEVHILPGSSSIMVRNNSIIGITPIKKKYFVLVRPVVTYEIVDGINLVMLFPGDMLQEKDNLRLQVVNYILYGDGKPIRGISHTFNLGMIGQVLCFLILGHIVPIPICFHTFLNRNKGGQSLIIFSSSNCFRINVSKYHNVTKESIKEKEDTPIPILNLLGPLGTVLKIFNFSPYYHSITHNENLLNKYLILDNNNSKQTFQLLKYYLVDENRRISNANPCSDIIFNLFGSCFVPHDYYEGTSTARIISLRQFICKNVCLSKYETCIKSGQVIMVYDITHSLPKVEQVLEVHSIDSISMNLEKRVEDWNEHITGILGIPWGFLIGAELTIAQSHISLVNKIQKVYQSQGVHIHNKHIEIIAIFYRAVLLGIARASPNTQSFISEASFQETARVLAKATLRGRIDWLKGLKENIVLGG